ncbi:hypothetical protein FGG08_002423 [Glutinoglossum americanum]|uniref:Uncharacterized protein n=1 Tax=Glutinoglossum americanum TaxID=1670608 RepID=A0A9P8L5L5_9PEZI|nr:hypothetical protein FGG08_002423 [Glutinoglossum americanum]
MAPSPTTPQHKSPGQKIDIAPIRTTSFLAAALLGRPITIQRRSSNDLEDRAAVSAEIRREGAKAKRQTLDLGKPLGPYDTNSVRERVRKWQSQGGGVVTQRDVVYPPEATPVVSEVGARTAQGSEDEETDIEVLRKRYRRERRKERMAEEKEQGEPKDEVVTPKKRVVSDGHWRKKSSPPRRVSGKGKQVDRSPGVPPDDGIRVKPIREESERRQRVDDDKASPKASLDNDGIRVYVTKRREGDTRKASKAVADDGGIRVYSARKGEGDGKKVSKTSVDEEGKENQTKRRDGVDRKASKASLDGDGNRVYGAKRQDGDGAGSKYSLDNDGIRVYSTRLRGSDRPKPRRPTEDIRRSPGSRSGGHTDEDSPSPKCSPGKGGRRIYSARRRGSGRPKPRRSTEETRRSPGSRSGGHTDEDSPSPKRSMGKDGVRIYSAGRQGSGRLKPRRSTENIRRSPGSRSGGHTDEDSPSPRHSRGSGGVRTYGSRRRGSGHPKPQRSTEDLRRSPGSRSGGQTDEDRPPQKATPTASRSRRKSNEHVEKTPEMSPREPKTPPAEGKTRRYKSGRQKSRTPEHSPRPRESPAVEERPKPKVQATKISVLKEIYDESKRALRSVRTPEPTPRPPGSRIEAWLSATPDPFVDPPHDPTVPEMPPSEISQPEPLPVVKEEEVDVHMSPSKSRRHRYHDSSIAANTTLSPENTRPKSPAQEILEILESNPQLVSSSELTQRRHHDSPVVADTDLPSERIRSKSPAQEILDIIETAPQLVSPNLKRAGAKRGSPSPTREKRQSSPVNKPSVQEVEGSTSSLAAEPQAGATSPIIDLQSDEFAGLPSTLKKRLSTIASVETLNVRATTPPAEPAVPATSEVTFNGDKQSIRTNHGELHESEAGDAFNTGIPEIPGKKSNLKRRLTTHADLISVLSLPRGGSKSIRSARSIRTNRSRLATATIGDLLRELATDETKYMRELRTLVDGVIPVLLTCALSKSDSAVVAELFNRAADSRKDDSNFTRPIIEMGIALERLKALHKKIPVHDVDELLRWANESQKAYSEYLKAWRLGFQDVVVNLAPGNEGRSAPDEQSVFNGLPRNENGDVIDGDGERVDVAFLLKRPLVRLKYLAKTLKGINYIRPSPGAEEQATRYQNLVIDARRRANEERSRLEDEAAANIDATRTRDPRTLGPLTGVSVDCTRRVRARDIFSMDLQHSSGQRMDCKVEIILRDDAPDRGNGGDLLICEVDGTGRWLLFPPVAFGRVSARNGSLKGEIVIMIRGYHGRGMEWQELLILHNIDEQVGFEWVKMLGLTPVPPEITRRPSFVVKDSRPLHPPSPSFLSDQPQSPGKSRMPNPRDIDVPIGEQARPVSRRMDNSGMAIPTRQRTRSYMEPVEEDVDSTASFAEVDDVDRNHGVPLPSYGRCESASPRSSHRATLETPEKCEPSSPAQDDSPVSPVSREPSGSLRDFSISPPSRKTSRQPEYASEPRYRPPKDLNEAMMMAGGRPPPSTLKRWKAKRHPRYDDDSPPKRRSSRHLDDNPRTPSPITHRSGKEVADRSPSPTTRLPSKKRTPSPAREIPIASSKIRVSRGEEITVSLPTHAPGRVERPSTRDSRLTYGEEEDVISGPRTPAAPKREASSESSEEESPPGGLPITKHRSPSAIPALDLPTIAKTRKADPVTPPRSPSRLSSEAAVLGSPLSSPDRGTSVVSKKSAWEQQPELPVKSELGRGDVPPPPPPHSPSPVQLKGSKTPALGYPSSAQQAGRRRRSSSPLKHEYEPSTASSSVTSESEESPAEEQDGSSFSESSEEEELEDGDAPTPLLPMAALRALGKASPHCSIYSLPNGNFSPTQQTPPARPLKSIKPSKAIASIFAWSEKGSWEPLHPDECSIVINPGLIEAFQMDGAHSRPTSSSDMEYSGDNARQPLVALELTPLVPLRRGTALDISIRSPPIGESKIKFGNNIMFRSRSPEECEALYGAINTSRIHNPKYIALQNAIPQADGLNPFMDRRNSVRAASSIWGWGSNKSSYRATGAIAPSIASSESSIGSFTSAFSALKRFGNGGRLFNISRSTISSRNGSRTGSTATSSSGASSNFGDGTSGGSGGNGTTTPPVVADEDPNKGSPIGLSNTKIRLYCRETASRWRDMGSARLTIMRPSLDNKPGSPHQHHPEEKRILVASKNANSPPLLDVCLGESCFERVARTGIALSVWEERIGEDGEVESVPAARGGVGGKTRVYMIQMKTEAETAYTFSLVGKLRY